MIDWIVNNWSSIASIFGSVVAIASVIVKLTPSDKDDKVLNKILEIIAKFSIFNTKIDQKIIDKNKK